MRVRAFVATAFALVGCGRIGFAVLTDAPADHFVDARATVSMPMPISDAAAIPSCPSLAWDGASWAVAWLDTRDGANGEVYMTFADVLGRKEIPDVRVTNDPAVTQCPSLLWTGSSFLVVFADARVAPNIQIFGQFVSAAGGLLGAPVQITSGTNDKTEPQIVWDGAGYDLAYNEVRGGLFDLKYARLTPAAAISGAVVTVINGGEFVNTALASTPSGVSIATSQYSGGWSLQIALVTSGAVAYQVPFGSTTTLSATALAWTGSELGAAWFDQAGTSFELMYGQVDPTSGAVSGLKPIASATQVESLAMAPGGGGFGLAPVAPNPADSFLMLGADGTPTDAPIAIGGKTPALAFDGTRFGCASITWIVPAVQLVLITPN